MEDNVEKLILDAAKKLFLQKGLAMTSTAEIAREAGCNTAMIHYYFRTKDKLFQAVFTAEVEKFSAGFEAIPLGNLSFEEKVVKITEIHFDFLRVNSQFPFLMINELTTNPKRAEYFKEIAVKKAGNIVSLMQVEMDKEIEKGNIRKITALELMLNIASLNIMVFLVEPIGVQMNLIDREEFLDRRRREIVDVIINSLKINGDEK